MADQCLTPQLQPQLAFDFEQSFELTKTIITAVMSGIVLLRDLLPDHCFDSRAFDPSDPNTSYAVFMAGTSLQRFPQPESVLNWRILMRGRCPKADKLLDWLELGVAEALQKKFLASLQLSIYKNGEIEPKNLVEAYIMSFAYDGGIPSLQLTTETSTTENASTKTLNLEYAKHGVNQLYEDFITSVQDSEILSEVTDEPSARPPGNKLSMHLTYHPSAPAGYHPPGFVTCEDSKLVIHDERGFVDGESNMSTGFHSVQAKYFVGDAEAAAITAPNKEVDVPIELAAAAASPASSSHLFAKPLIPRARQESASSIIDGGTQQSHVGLLNRVGPSTETALHDTQPVMTTQQAHTAIGFSPILGESLISWDRTTIERYQKMCRTGPYAESCREVCECGSSSTENTDVMEAQLVQCDCCGLFYHLQCYGYLEAEETPMQSICYACLLDGDAESLSELRELCLYRKILYHLFTHGVPATANAFVTHFELDTDQAQAVTAMLKADGFLEGDWKGYKKPILRISLAQLRKKVFRPEYKILQHFAVMGGHSQDNGTNPGQYNLIRSGFQPLVEIASTAAIQSQANYPRGEGSSTQGTPSPQFEPRTPRQSPMKPPKSGGLFKNIATRKRSAEDDGSESRKRPNYGAANSPWTPYNRGG